MGKTNMFPIQAKKTSFFYSSLVLFPLLPRGRHGLHPHLLLPPLRLLLPRGNGRLRMRRVQQEDRADEVRWTEGRWRRDWDDNADGGNPCFSPQFDIIFEWKKNKQTCFSSFVSYARLLSLVHDHEASSILWLKWALQEKVAFSHENQ